MVVLCVFFADDCLKICVLCMYVLQFEDIVIGSENNSSQIITRVGENIEKLKLSYSCWWEGM